jgi:hypothetical protein
MTIEETNWILSLPKETKLKLLGDMVKEGHHMMALELCKILLDAPITKGGVSTEELNEVMKAPNIK